MPAASPGQYLKWGASKRAGTSGGVVTWGFVAEGTPGTEYCEPYCQGESLGQLPHFFPSPQRDNRTVPMPIEQLQPVFQAAFDAWAAVADIRFRYTGIDDSRLPIDDPGAMQPMIRIGIWRHAGLAAYFCAAVAYPPGLRGSGVAGHVFLNANVGYQLSHGEEGERVGDFPCGGGLHMTDLYLLALRETGHTIGLADSMHPDSVMRRGDASATLRPTLLWRMPRADDVAGARFLYGPPTRHPE
ncbi:hypothetical protein FSC37_05730 [Piscinibacter aquaticus]|uniref:Uncharacterized protein n=1 Tax=Piscinibacter aquaticus TaxID=392597 RepID=A0A5C6U1T9_9BURK|nr:hypothetical protein FSC37_05730 [Piscinibacter aquaticus]